MKKVCGKCKEEKDISLFYKNKNMKDGYAFQCKYCCKEYDTKNIEKSKQRSDRYYAKNSEKIKKKGKQWKKNNSERVNKLNKQWRDEHPDIIKTARQKCRLKQNFNISLEVYYEMLEKQNHCCAICGKHENKLKKRLAIDHNHKTGEIRGLLCSNCNLAISLFDDDQTILYKAINYLKCKI